MTETPEIAGYKPCYVELEKGKTYLWCACGRSKNQPFCDSSHRGTSLRPTKYIAQEEGEEVLFCACKRSGDAPFCDGSHNSLKDKYDEDDPQSRENLAIRQVEVSDDGKARLNGSCFVCSIPALPLERNGTLGFASAIASSDGAKYQSQFYLEAASGESPVISFGDRHVVLLVTEGKGTVLISGQSFDVKETDGVYIRGGEAFSFQNAGPETIKVFAAVCPQAEQPTFLDEMPQDFEASLPKRVVSVDPSERQSMADRFFQLLVDKKIGSDVVTQFIGEIPVSKAMPHRHLYEETLVILKGEGCMWTDSKKASVRAGDIIFLPRKQLHSLQCTDDNGMLVAGVIYPGDNPSINY